MSLTTKDLENIGELMDEKLKPVKKDLKSIKRKLNLTIRSFDHDFNYHHRRLEKLEEKAGVKPPDFVPLPN
jgi:hypothetical protein